MQKIDDRFYKGYEGEPEIRFTYLHKDGLKDVLSIWEGYFDEIMHAIKPGPDGWTSLAYCYHMLKGWEEESPWTISKLSEAMDQLKGIDVEGLSEASIIVLDRLCNWLKQAIDKNESISIEKD